MPAQLLTGKMQTVVTVPTSGVSLIGRGGGRVSSDFFGLRKLVPRSVTFDYSTRWEECSAVLLFSSPSSLSGHEAPSERKAEMDASCA